MKRKRHAEVSVARIATVNRVAKGVAQVDDHAWFSFAAVSDLKRRDCEFDGKRINNKRTAYRAKGALRGEKFINNKRIG